jgi:hypothetical protein
MNSTELGLTYSKTHKILNSCAAGLKRVLLLWQVIYLKHYKILHHLWLKRCNGITVQQVLANETIMFFPPYNDNNFKQL